MLSEQNVEPVICSFAAETGCLFRRPVRSAEQSEGFQGAEGVLMNSTLGTAIRLVQISYEMARTKRCRGWAE